MTHGAGEQRREPHPHRLDQGDSLDQPVRDRVGKVAVSLAAQLAELAADVAKMREGRPSI
jgi:hypothetical protein